MISAMRSPGLVACAPPAATWHKTNPANSRFLKYRFMGFTSVLTNFTTSFGIVGNFVRTMVARPTFAFDSEQKECQYRNQYRSTVFGLKCFRNSGLFWFVCIPFPIFVNLHSHNQE